MRRNIRGRRDRAAKSRIKITRVAFVSFRVNWYCTKRWARDEASGRSAQNTEQGKNTFLSFRSSSKRSNVARYKGSFPRLCIFSFLSGRKNNTIDRGGGRGGGFRSSLMQEKPATEFPVEVFRLSQRRRRRRRRRRGKSWRRWKLRWSKESVRVELSSV